MFFVELPNCGLNNQTLFCKILFFTERNKIVDISQNAHMYEAQLLKTGLRYFHGS